MTRTLTDELFKEFVTELWNEICTTPEGETKLTWKCGLGEDRFHYSRELAQRMDVSLDEVKEALHAHCCCDCEIVWNAPDWVDDDELA